MKFLNLTLLIIFCLISYPKNLNAQWSQTNGPYGGKVYCSLNDGNRLFIGTNNGIFYSDNNGSNWIGNTESLKNETVNSLVNYRNALVAGTQKHGLFVSFDNGESWSELNINLAPETVYDLEVQDSVLFARIPGKLYRLKSFQQNWELINNNSNYIKSYKNNLYSESIYSRSIDGMYSAVDAYLNVSKDYGDTWDSVGTIIQNESFSSLFMNDSVLILNREGNSGILLSTDQGKTWSVISSSIFSNVIIGIWYINDRVYCLTSNALTLNTIYWDYDVNINWKSIGDKFDWKTLNINKDLIVSTLFDSQGYLLIGTQGWEKSLGGVFQYNEVADTLIEINNGIIATNVLIDAKNDNILVIGNGYNYLFYTNDNGSSWKRIKYPPLEDIDLSIYYTLVVSLNNNLLYIGNGSTYGIYGGIYYSSNLGETWNNIPTDENFNDVNSLAFIDSFIVASGINKIFVTSDKGTSWKNVNGPITSAVYWIAEQNGVLLAATNQGLYYSTDIGTTWISSIGGDIDNYISSFAHNENYFYLGSYNKGIFISSDSGRSFKSFNNGLENKYIISIASKGNLVFALTDQGIFYVENNANNWNRLNKENSPSGINSIGISGSYLFAGTYNNGVFRFPLSQISAIKEETNRPIEKFSLFQNYPNPFNPSTTINYEIPKSGLVTIKIYDVLGREVETLVNEEKKAGKYNVKFDGSKLTSGVYFYKIITNNFTKTKKMLLMK